MITLRSHQIAKHYPYFHLQQDILKNFFFKAEKVKRSRRQKNIHITNRITKFSVPSFYKYYRNEIDNHTLPAVPSPDQRSEGALAENGGHYKNRLNFCT